MIRNVAVIGTGLIGASWAAQFLAQGLDVAAYDPAPGAEAALRRAIEAHWPVLEAIGLAPGADPARLRVLDRVEAAVEGAGFVQESGPERLEIKRPLFATICAAAPAEVVVASSSSYMLMSDVQPGCTHPERIVLGHPFNPPHLIPLVEVVGSATSSEAAVAAAMAFYRQIGKHPIRLLKEKRGHIANRLQAALWQEVFALLLEGVADAEAIDAAIAHGPGLRWALLGPLLNLELAGGAGGIAHMLAHLGPPTEAIWRELGQVRLDEATLARLEALVSAQVAGRDMAQTVAARDAALVGLLRAKAAAPALP